MDLRDRTDHPDRRTDDVAPIVERRGGTEQRQPAWVKRMEKNAKDLTGRAA